MKTKADYSRKMNTRLVNVCFKPTDIVETRETSEWRGPAGKRMGGPANNIIKGAGQFRSGAFYIEKILWLLCVVNCLFDFGVNPTPQIA